MRWTRMMNRIGRLTIAAALFLASCGGGGGGGGGPLAGRWAGPIQSDDGGPGVITLRFNQSGEGLTGTWVTQFGNPSFDNEGTLRGTVIDDTVQVLLDSANPDVCDFDAVGIREGDDRITGSYQTTDACATSRGGTFDVTRR